MTRRDVVLVGASAGGVEALRTLLAGLPAGFPASILVVLHISAAGPSALPMILGRAGRLPARHAMHGEKLVPGKVYVAPPDRHLAVVDARVALSAGPRENGHRPAVDVLFRTAARGVGSRAIGVVLSGNLDDGTAGLRALRDCGGIGVVQDPDEALYPGMPRSAVRHAEPEYVLPIAAIPALLTELVTRHEPVDATPADPRLLAEETDAAVMDLDAMTRLEPPGEPAGYSCPDCSGVLFRIGDGEQVRFRCRVGHAWSATALAGQMEINVESALWVALRSLNEKAAFSAEMADRQRREGRPNAAASLARQARDATDAAAVLRDMLDRRRPAVIDEDGAPAREFYPDRQPDDIEPGSAAVHGPEPA